MKALETPNPFFKACAEWALRHRFFALSLTLLSALFSLWLILDRLYVDTGVEAFSSSQNEAQQVLEEYRDEFGQDLSFIFLVEGEVFSLEYLKRLKSLHQALEGFEMELGSLGERKQDRERRRGRLEELKESPKLKDFEEGEFGEGDFGEDEGWGEERGGSLVEELISLINVRQTRASAEGIEVGELMDPFPTAEELPQLQARVLSDPSLVGQVLGAKGRHSLLLLRSAFLNDGDMKAMQSALEQLIQAHQAPGFKVSVSGEPAMSKGLHELMIYDLKRLMLYSLLTMALFLAFLFRHPLGVLAPVLVVGMAALNAFALMAALDMPVTLLTNVVPGFLFCVGVGDAVHIISVYRDRFQQGGDSRAAVIHAVSTTGMPVLYTSLTTMVGLLSFRFASLSAIQELGIAGAFGVMMAMLHSLISLPILLSFNQKSPLGKRPGQEGDFLDRLLNLCLLASACPGDTGEGAEPPQGRRRRRFNISLGAALSAAALLGISLLHVWHNPMSWIPEDAPVHINFSTLDRETGGAATIHLLLEMEAERGIKDKALLEGLEALQAHILAYKDKEQGHIVGNAISILDVVKESNRALRGGGEAAYRLPETQRGVADLLFLFESAAPEQLRRLASADLSRSRMTLRVRWLEATSYERLAEHIEEGIERLIPKGTRIRTTGSVYTLMSTIHALIRDLLRSFAVAFLLITLLMILLLGDLKLGLIAMVPNLMPIIFIMGLMGFLSIPIDLNNLLLASISIGIAVDATIHLLHQFKLSYEITGNVERSIKGAMEHSGRAIVSTGMILMAGFFVYTQAEMINLARFGLLVGLTSLVALIIDLVFTPALLRSLYRDSKGS